MKKMPEKIIAVFMAKMAPYWEVLFAVLMALIGGALAFLNDVQTGDRKWDLRAFVLDVCTSGFFGYVTFMVFVELFSWSPSMSAAACAVVGHLGAKNVKKLLTGFITRKLQ